MKKNLKDLYNQSADAYYLAHTKKTEAQLRGYMSYERANWADGQTGDEWEDETECRMCAEEAASQALEREEADMALDVE